MSDMYYLIRNTDGDTYVEEIDKETLLKRLDEKDDGDDLEILDSMPAEGDTNYWGGDMLIIKGSIIKPQAKKVVTKYDVE